MNSAMVPSRSAALALLALGGLAMSVAHADRFSAPAPAAFVAQDDLIKWLSDGERGVWLQAGSLRWFYARIEGRCPGLGAAHSLVFDTAASSRIDRSSSVVVPGGERCRVRSFLPSGGPPKDRNSHVQMQPQSQ
ncbi:MAG TPA: hypothetical protein VGR86_05075 [Steroidobacteraceae bacterium]|nr:hypothetical protein [Steroidobacteraceae bacterium]